MLLHKPSLPRCGQNKFNTDTAKASGKDQISAKFLKDGAPVIAIYLCR